MLPTFLASSYDDLHRVLATEVAIPLHYWIVTRVESRRRAAVTAVIEALSNTLAAMSDAKGTRR